jgi:hypothetical protein
LAAAVHSSRFLHSFLRLLLLVPTFSVLVSNPDLVVVVVVALVLLSFLASFLPLVLDLVLSVTVSPPHDYEARRKSYHFLLPALWIGFLFSWYLW